MRVLQAFLRIGIVVLPAGIMAACQTWDGVSSASEGAELPRSVAAATELAGDVPGTDPAPPLSASSASIASAVRPGRLTMEDAVRRTMASHPSIDQAMALISESEERIRAAQAGYFPHIGAGINSGYQRDGRSGWSPRFEVNASQLLYDFGKVSSSVDTEIAGKDVSRARLLLTVDRLAVDAANAVIEVQRFRELSRLSEGQVEGVRAIAALVDERTGRGASTLSDQVQVNARLETAQATHLQNLAEHSRWRVALASMTGDPAGVEPVAEAPTFLSGACDVAQPDWLNVPDLLEAEAQREVASAQLAGSRAEIFPTISLEASSTYDLGSGRDNVSDQDDRLDYFIGVSASSSLYNGGQTGARRRAAAHALTSAGAAIDTARLETRRALMEAGSQIGTLGRLRDSLTARSDMTAHTRDLYREQYLSLGTRTLLDLLNSEQEFHEAEFQIANTTHDIRRLNVVCLHKSGQVRHSFGLDPDRLRQPVGVQ